MTGYSTGLKSNECANGSFRNVMMMIEVQRSTYPTEEIDCIFHFD